ncbi:hypothetical protein Y82_3145 [Pseudomonas aeruginosa]|nr:hypothetical protein Y82_3145 [Pseudomonas aeruginosa]
MASPSHCNGVSHASPETEEGLQLGPWPGHTCHPHPRRRCRCRLHRHYRPHHRSHCRLHRHRHLHCRPLLHYRCHRRHRRRHHRPHRLHHRPISITHVVPDHFAADTTVLVGLVRVSRVRRSWVSRVCGSGLLPPELSSVVNIIAGECARARTKSLRRVGIHRPHVEAPRATRQPCLQTFSIEPRPFKSGRIKDHDVVCPALSRHWFHRAYTCEPLRRISHYQGTPCHAKRRT